ncbi:MAG: type II toxin-antitoxin system VapC family toxin [Chloroflexaceae bacterium]
MYTLDANIFVRDLAPGDPNYADCHALLEQLSNGSHRIIVPLLILVEVAGTVSRATRDPIRGRLAAEILHEQPHITFVTLDATLTETAAHLAADRALRGADAIYVAVARGSGCTLITLDQEMRVRAAPIVTVRTPGEALAEITPP